MHKTFRSLGILRNAILTPHHYTMMKVILADPTIKKAMVPMAPTSRQNRPICQIC